MRVAAAFLFAGVVAGAVGCKDTPKQPPKDKPEPGSAGPSDPHVGVTRDAADTGPAIDWAACEAAVTKAATAPLAARPAILIDGCHVCGDWSPILRWNTLQTNGGPKRLDIENAMAACNAYCLGEAKLKFLGTLDDARGRSSRMPWKQLALLCGPKVSAVPDDRFVDGPYFLLDRVARFVGDKGPPELSTKLAAIELPLQLVSVVGTGPPLPKVGAGATTAISELQVTVIAGTISVGRAPRAHLTKDGVQVDLGPDGYPGKPVKATELASALKTIARPAETVMVVAAAPTPASQLIAAVAAANAAAIPAFLAARAAESPEGWDLPAVIPVNLDAGGKNALPVSKDMSVQQLADELVKQAARGANRIGISGP